ncbi:uncharacterized protein BCR38DRAFT_522585 [Pseudomassariella vexata]|uniref:Uncharacterized protein n=1 Tax=Pseudomassariella vexata TaxID=1141098 RepID=A0A1Y2E847_9PEZI|nr:uncharacterized protein BCR38DRAFT_522585 [Pseudomassariella vexata]ORY67709.1 hypothetical protein BCR38DRAFT_522585 [Pseudomassariella vexata]
MSVHSKMSYASRMSSSSGSKEQFLLTAMPNAFLPVNSAGAESYSNIPMQDLRPKAEHPAPTRTGTLTPYNSHSSTNGNVRSGTNEPLNAWQREHAKKLEDIEIRLSQTKQYYSDFNRMRFSHCIISISTIAVLVWYGIRLAQLDSQVFDNPSG